MKHSKRRIQRIAAMVLSVAMLMSNAQALSSGKWLHQSSLSLADTLRMESGIYIQPEAGNRQSEHVLEYTPGGDVYPMVAYGSTLYGRSTLEYVTTQYLEPAGLSMAAGINGSFFDVATGLPLGCVITEGILRTSGDTASIGFRADGTALIGKPGLTIAVTYPNGEYSHVHYNKQLTNGNGVVLYSRDYDTRTKNTVSGYHVVLQPEAGTLPLTGTLSASVVDIVTDTQTCQIPEGGMVLAVATQTDYAYTMASRILALTVGDTVTISVSCDEAWQDVVYACGGGDLLVTDGMAAETFTLDSAERLAARTAVGLKADGTLVFFTTDGLQADARGLTLPETAARMAELGCVTALNLDGGGSTALGAAYPGETALTVINSPSDGALRRSANFIFLVRKMVPSGSASRLHLYPYDVLALAGSQFTPAVRATDSAGMPAEVPQRLTFRAENAQVTEDGLVTAGTGGGSVTVRSGEMESTAKITVISAPTEIQLYQQSGSRALRSLTVGARSRTDLQAEASYYGLPVFDDDSLYTWEVSGGIGQIDETGLFTAVQTTEPMTGQIRVSYGTTSTVIPVTVTAMTLSGSVVQSFETEGTAATAGAGLQVTENRDLTKVRYGSASLCADYAFAQVQAEEGVKKQVRMATKTILPEDTDVLGVWILGDNSGNALSARVAVDGKETSIWLTTLNFTGWKFVTAELGAGRKNLTGFALTQEENGAESGTIYLDQVTAANGVFADTEPPVITTVLTESALQIEVSDALSGLQHAAVFLDGREQTVSWEAGRTQLALPTDGAYHRLTVTASDRFGNLVSYTMEVEGELEPVFIDTQTHWAKTQIAYLYREGVLTGSADGQGNLCYRPDDSMTRQEFIVALMRWLGDSVPQTDGTLPFADTAAIANWAKDAMTRAYELGLLTGSSKQGVLYANPTATITRQEAMAIIGRTQEKGYVEAELQEFSDFNQVALWAYEHIAAMVTRGVISGSGGALLPSGPVTRAQVAKILCQLT